ncbi:hypothetical protein Tco_0268583 [Tanacetum coccineum]
MANIRRYREYDLAHLKLVFEFCIYTFWKSVQYGLSKGLDTAYLSFLEHGYAVSSLTDTAYCMFSQVMAVLVISILSDTSKESVAGPIVTPEVGTVSVVSPAGVLDLVNYSPSFDFDPSEDSLPPAPYLPLVSPFLCSDDTEVDGESEPAEQRPVSSSHDTLAPLSEFPLAPVVASPSIHRRSATLVRPGEVIPFGRPYRTHLNGPRKLLTERKRVRPISARRLRFVHRSLARTLRHSEAFRRWRSAPLSTPYLPTKSESSLGSSSKRSLDSSSPSFRPSRKRCRSLTASVPSPTHVSRSIAPTPVLARGMGFKIAASDVREDDEEFEAEAIHYMSEVCIDRSTEIETTQRQLETSQMVASGERAVMVEKEW